MNPSGSRPPRFAALQRPSAARAPGARILGDQRREVAEAAAQAARASKRRLERDDIDDLDDTEDSFSNATGLFADEEYDQEDMEADAIYAAVEERMDAKRHIAREARINAQLAAYRAENPTIKQQFAESKQQLAEISFNEWGSVPDIGDYSVKKRKLDKFTPVPDSVHQAARVQAQAGAGTPSSGMVRTATAASGAATDLAAIGAGRASVFGHNLDRAGSSGTLSTIPAVDATGYLTEMAGVHISSAAEINDIKRARLLLKSVTTTNPTHAPGWIAAARLEEVAGRMAVARDLAGEGCRRCPREEDVWLEAARLYPCERARQVLAQAVVHVPRSVKVWLQAAALEEDQVRRRRVLRKALEIVPRSARLWRAAVELEEKEGARILLRRAVECVPDDVDLWLALAKLESYENAKKVLSRARAALPTEPTIWVTAARLEEQARGVDNPLIGELLQNAVKSLSINSHIVKRERWLDEATDADKTGFPATCRAIVDAALPLGVEKVDRMDVWSEDADAAERSGFSGLARVIHAKITQAFPAHENLWIRSSEFEKRAGNSQSMEKVLEEAVQYCARVEVLWLMLAKEQWVSGDVNLARKTLEKALDANRDSEAIWVAAAKVETEAGEYEKARVLLKRAREEAVSPRVVMKSALMERLLRNHAKELAFLDEGVSDFPRDHKLWLMLAQWHERNSNLTLVKRDISNEPASNPDAMDTKDDTIQSVFSSPREVYDKAVENCPRCAPLWIGLARLVERTSSPAAARAVLERARLLNKNKPDVGALWRESVFLEVRLGGAATTRAGARAAAGLQADTLLARALQECPKDGPLWALSMALAPAAERKARTGDALRECGRDACVILEAGRLLWRDGKTAKARKWLARSVELDPDCGDAWGALLSYERAHGTPESVQNLEKRAVKAEPKHGDLWCAMRKKVGNERLGVLEVLRAVATHSAGETCTTGMFAV